MNANHHSSSGSAAFAARNLRVLRYPCTKMKDPETLPPIALERATCD
jgi:hypothetical protein